MSALRLDPWPTPEQRLLLHAILSPPERALAAWREWSGRVDFETLDRESNFLLPALSRALPALGVADHPWLGRMRGFHRRAWVHNRQLLAKAGEVVRGLTDLLGEPPILLKGAALICRGDYADAGLRPMLDFDLLVPEARAADAAVWLQAQAWRPEGGMESVGAPLVSAPARWRRYFHAQDFRQRDGAGLDLHWHLLPEFGFPESSTELQVRAQLRTLPDGTPVRVPAPTDLLFHLCLHGVRWLPVAPARWVCDVLHLLRREAGAVDWELLRECARQRRCTLRLGQTLTWLEHEFPEAGIPVAVSAALRAVPPAPGEQAEYDKRNLPPSGDPGLGVRDAFALYRARAGALPPRLILELLANRWQLRRVADVPGHALRAAFGRWRRSRGPGPMPVS